MPEANQNININDTRAAVYKFLKAANDSVAHDTHNETEDAFIINLVSAVCEAMVYVGDAIFLQTNIGVQMQQSALQQQAQRESQKIVSSLNIPGVPGSKKG